MSQLVKKTLCITASSVPSERLFSSAGNLVNQKDRAFPQKMLTICYFYMKCNNIHYEVIVTVNKKN